MCAFLDNNFQQFGGGSSAAADELANLQRDGSQMMAGGGSSFDDSRVPVANKRLMLGGGSFDESRVPPVVGEQAPTDRRAILMGYANRTRAPVAQKRIGFNDRLAQIKASRAGGSSASDSLYNDRFASLQKDRSSLDADRAAFTAEKKAAQQPIERDFA